MEIVATAEEMVEFGRRFAKSLSAGDVVMLWGDLGAGKTTIVRGILAGLGLCDPVRSPTFNIIQVFDTTPPVVHADLYRVRGWEGLGLEDYLETHLCLIEWPDRAKGLVALDQAIQVRIEFAGHGRTVQIIPPQNR
ncbi:MAG: tRNA (adenosine(37)-N6)-threonylcarbamoyltransferase complex ATPase subunit type 1 TsaE [Armatimonadetes bacterium]|nr:tRNA (adenosine(37)-N6)-threonylcarbamoyltransferase complex ATPase subunit type 1 TsaE [Armatimonadota bacterium]